MCDSVTELNRTVMTGVIHSNDAAAEDFFVMSVAVSDAFQAAMPGQFVMVRIKGRDFPFLPRPFSIFSVAHEGGTTIIEILYQVVGKGTKLLSRLGRGDELTILGPLGKGFDIRQDRHTIVLIAGGVGIAPLYFLAEYCKGSDDVPEKQTRIICFMGARTADYLIGRERLDKICDTLLVSTDDGSEGYCGTVTDCFENHIGSVNVEDSTLYCCGPYLMMQSVARKVRKYSMPCQVSMEARMACGIGACLGCSVKMKTDDETVRYLRVCKDGPVFDVAMIDW